MVTLAQIWQNNQNFTDSSTGGIHNKNKKNSATTHASLQTLNTTIELNNQKPGCDENGNFLPYPWETLLN